MPPDTLLFGGIFFAGTRGLLRCRVDADRVKGKTRSRNLCENGPHKPTMWCG